MKTNSSKRLFHLALIIALTARLSLPANAGGPMGVDVGWVISNTGSPYLTSAQAASYVQAKTGYIRMEFRLVNGNTNWNTTMLGYYDTVVNNARAAGLQIIGLIDYTSWPGNQSEWTANNYECSGGNGDNSYIDGFAQNAVVPLVQHFHDRIQIFELWNEPNACTTCSQCGTMGGSYIYPSNFGQLLANSYADLEYAGLKNYVTILAGGVFGHNIGGVNSYGNAGAQYIDDTYNTGINKVGSFSYTKSHWNTYPLDAIGEHIYIDQGGATTSANVSQYMNWVRSAYTKYEGTGTGKKTMITEFGWTTASVSTNTQDANLKTAFGVFETNPQIVSHAIWFDWQDGGAGNYGILDGNGNHKLSYADYQFYEQYEGYYSNGSIDNNILNYFNARGQAVLGDAFDHGGGAFVHGWSGGGSYANVQDFQGGSDLGLTVFDSSFGTFEVNDIHGMWTFYQTYGGIGMFGSPKNNEYPSGSGTQQDFANGSLTWNATSGVHWSAAWLNTSFESGQTQPTWSDTQDSNANVSGYNSNINPECSTRQEQAHTGTTALMYSGTDNSTTRSFVYFRVFQVNIPITSDTKMSYWIYPQQNNGRYVGVDYYCSDGTDLRDSGAVDYNGFSMHPNAGHGGNIPLNAWTDIKCNVGQWLAGKTIVKIQVAYDQPPNTGQFRGYIDDILITNGALP